MISPVKQHGNEIEDLSQLIICCFPFDGELLVHSKTQHQIVVVDCKIELYIVTRMDVKVNRKK